MLAVEGVQTGYRTRKVSETVSFSVSRGEVVCLLGPNGSGKTTLFRTLVGSLPIHRGEIRLDGVAVGSMTLRERACRVAYVPQIHRPPFPFRVLEAVALGRIAHIGSWGAPSGADLAIAAAALAEIGGADLAQRTVTELSGGELQRVLLARALAQGSDLLLLDEPTAHLDLGQAHRVSGLVRRLADTGKAILWTTHDPSQALRWADRVVLLHEGRVRSVGPPSQVLDPESFEHVFGVRAHVVAVTTRNGRSWHRCDIEEEA